MGHMSQYRSAGRESRYEELSGVRNMNITRRFLAFIALATGLIGQSRHVVVIAHRGEHLSHPENTIAAFQAAVDAGADFFELDVRTTSDGKFVLMHDSTVDRMTNGHGE